MSTAPLDPRSICNLMLEEADRSGLAITNLALQKLLYFAHARYLIETKRPLVSGYFEAWQFGPVHPAAYKAFKAAENRPITFRAKKIDPLTGNETDLQTPRDANTVRLISQIMASFGTMTPGRLVDISHAKDAPWHFVVGEARSTMAFGMRIPDNVIIERYRHHKMSVGAAPLSGEPGEDTPFAGDGPGAHRATAG